MGKPAEIPDIPKEDLLANNGALIRKNFFPYLVELASGLPMEQLQPMVLQWIKEMSIVGKRDGYSEDRKISEISLLVENFPWITESADCASEMSHVLYGSAYSGEIDLAQKVFANFPSTGLSFDEAVNLANALLEEGKVGMLEKFIKSGATFVDGVSSDSDDWLRAMLNRNQKEKSLQDFVENSFLHSLIHQFHDRTYQDSLPSIRYLLSRKELLVDDCLFDAWEKSLLKSIANASNKDAIGDRDGWEIALPRVQWAREEYRKHACQHELEAGLMVVPIPPAFKL